MSFLLTLLVCYSLLCLHTTCEYLTTVYRDEVKFSKKEMLKDYFGLWYAGICTLFIAIWMFGFLLCEALKRGWHWCNARPYK